MGYSTEATVWPETPIPAAIKKLIDLLFATLDDSSLSAGSRLANDIFASDGLIAGTHPVLGADAIRRSRESAWQTIGSRRHSIDRVYAHNTAASDLLLIGNVVCGLRNGAEVSAGFTSRLVIGNATGQEPRVQLYQVWMDPSPIRKAIAQTVE